MTTKVDVRAPAAPLARATDPDPALARQELETKVRETVSKMIAKDGFAALVDGGAPILRALGIDPAESNACVPTRPLGFTFDAEEG